MKHIISRWTGFQAITEEFDKNGHLITTTEHPVQWYEHILILLFWFIIIYFIWRL